MANLPGTSGNDQREFEFTQDDFNRIKRLIYKRAGIVLTPAKQEMAYSRITRRLRALGLRSIKGYLDDLEKRDSAAEWEAFTNALTTNLTAFFRESHHFPILANHVMDRKGVIKIWCSAASTGEEPYSIAMTVCEAFKDLKPPVKIIASDIDTNVLREAEAGIYSMEQLNNTLSPQRIKKFFLRGTGANEGAARIRPELRSLIEFRQINLLDASWRLDGPFDVIFCRNVMIYFDKDTQKKILAHFAQYLKKDGLLFAGHSEVFAQITKQFKLQEKTVYVLTNQE